MKIKKAIAVMIAAIMLAGLFGVSATASAQTAAPSAHSVMVNGEPVAFRAFNIGGNNFFMLRDVAYALSGTTGRFDVTWDTARGAINLITGVAYDGAGLATGTDEAVTATPSTAVVYVDGERADLRAYTIAGNNFFMLRDLGTALGFDVDFDRDTQTVLIITPSGEEIEIGSEASLRAAVASAGTASTVIALSGNISLEEELTIPAGADITLRSTAGAFALSAAGDFTVVVVEEGASLTIDGVNITRVGGTRGRGITNRGSLTLADGVISGHNPPEIADPEMGPDAAVFARGAGVFNRGELVMTGGEISGNTAQVGTGVHNGGGATFTLQGGVIRNNSAEGHEHANSAGVQNSASFTMTGGEISGNTSSVNAGGVGNLSAGTFNMTGGEISGNTAVNGGGVTNFSDGTFNMSGGEISNNTAEFAGGVNNFGTFNLTDGAVSNNTAENSSGGVSVGTGGVFNISGGEISDNTAQWAGGVGTWNGTTTMTGGTISGNTATSGGGIALNQGATFTLENGTISGNTTENGAGAAIWEGTLNMTGGAISDNTTGGNGGGVHLSNVEAVFNMTGGEISGNTANWGGGVGTYRGTINMTGGTISANTATGGGGVGTWNGTTFTMSGGTISDNTAAEAGGGVNNGSYGTFTITGGTITRNHAGTWGGGVISWGADRTFNNNGGTISGNTADEGAPQISDGQ